MNLGVRALWLGTACTFRTSIFRTDAIHDRQSNLHGHGQGSDGSKCNKEQHSPVPRAVTAGMHWKTS